MTKRTQAMYCAMLRYIAEKAADVFNIQLTPTRILTDFEKAAINAFDEIFPSAVVTGCHFHLGQSVMRKVNELGLKTIYTSDQDFALHARMLYGLAYVPTADVPTALELIRATMPAVGQPLVQYFDSTYVNGSVRRPPMFHPAMWNVAELFEHTLPTTSNHVEAWHRRLQTLIVIDHPSFYVCLHKLRQEQRRTEIALMRCNNGFRRTRQRRSTTEHTQRLTTLMSDLRCGRKNLTAFLRGVGHAFGKSDAEGEDADVANSDEEDGSQQVSSRNADLAANVHVGYFTFYLAKSYA